MPKEFFSKIDEDFDKCDLLIIMGTSLKVEPFASLTSMVDSDCPRLLINQEAVGYDLIYDRKSVNYRDVFLKGTCDDACLKLACLLNWKNELEKLSSWSWTWMVTYKNMFLCYIVSKFIFIKKTPLLLLAWNVYFKNKWVSNSDTTVHSFINSFSEQIEILLKFLFFY